MSLPAECRRVLNCNRDDSSHDVRLPSFDRSLLHSALVTSCLDAYSNTVNYATWNELKQVAAKNLRGEEPEPDWEEDEPVYDGLQARGRDMEKVMDDHVASDQRQAVKRAAGEGSALAAKAARNNELFLCAFLLP